MKSNSKKKRALIFIEDCPYEYDNRVKREARALNDAGWDVTVISPGFKEHKFYSELAPNLRSYHYPKNYADSAIGHLVEHSCTLLFGTAVTTLVSVKHGFTVFHACNPLDVLWMIAAPYKLLGKKFIFDHHDLSPELYLSRDGVKGGDLFERALRWFERASFAMSDASIATNESYAQIAVERGGMKRDDVFVVRNGPDLNRLHRVPPREDLKAPGQTLVGYLGNMNQADGVDHLLMAARIITQEHRRDDVRFMLVGGAAHQPTLKKIAREMKVDDVVTFTGRIPDEEMLPVLCACDICVQPDPRNPLNDKSTMNKLMEYMALGIPVVSYDLTESRVSGGDAVLYAEPDNPHALAARILELVDDPARREELGRSGLERVETKLAWPFSVPNLLAAYERATS